MKLALLDKIRQFIKRVTNKILLPIAGRSFGHFAVLEHQGRRTGRLYRIPVIAEPTGDGFIFALTDGRKVDWYRNVAASGSCRLTWKNRSFQLVDPCFIPPQVALQAFLRLLRPALLRAGVKDFVKMGIA